MIVQHPRMSADKNSMMFLGRRRVLVPVGVLGALVAAFGAFASSSLGPTSEPAPSALQTTPASGSERHNGQPATTKTHRRRHAATGSSATLRRALQTHGAAVVFIYSPRSPVDRIAAVGARAGAQMADAAFIPVDAADERAIAYFVHAFGVRQAPMLLVFGRGPRLVTTLDGVFDRTTVAQAAENARG
jgi:hypothetical protein